MENPKRNWWRLLRDAAVLSVFHVPLMALAPMVNEVLSSGTLCLLALCGVLSFFILWDERISNVLLKWAVSLPLSLLWAAMVGNYNVRWINLQDPGYGRLSAGGGFAMMIEFGMLTVARGFALVAAIGFSGEKKLAPGKVVQRIKAIALPVLAAAVLILVLYMNAIMPTWDEIYWSTYG